MKNLANYTKERHALQEFYTNKHKILLFHGKCGVGKTTLLSEYLNCGIQKFSYVPFNFNDFVDTSIIFQAIGDLLGWDNLPKLSQEINRNVSPVVKVNNNLLFNRNNINIALTSDKKSEKERRLHQFTSALFMDIKKISRPILFLFDAYENANIEVTSWLAHFLTRVAQLEKIKVIIAGQTLPDINNITFGSYTTTYELTGIQNAEEWIAFSHIITNSVDERFCDALRLVCRAYNGHPHDISKFIYGLAQNGY